jgi:hypothetical protein
MMPDLRIRVANLRDVPGLTALESRYYIGNLDADERANGFLSILHPPQWFTRVVEDGAVHVAMTGNDDVAGFIVISAPPDPTETGLPEVIKGMLELTETLEMNGTPIARQRFAIRGPVCIAEEVRGRGVYSAFHAITMKAYRDRFDLGVLFVAADNPRSLHTTTAKLGARSLAEFEAGGKRFHFLAFEFGSNAEVTTGPHIAENPSPEPDGRSR